MPAMTDKHWALIHAAGGDPDRLFAELTPLSTEELMDFGRAYSEALIELNRWEIWGAGFVMGRSLGWWMSGDSFHYFRSWIIGHGKAAYDIALSSPDDLGQFHGGEDDEFENELLEYVVLDVLEERGVEDDPRDTADGNADDTPRGTEFDPNTVHAQFPKLAAQFPPLEA
jgi:hypothetical protein